ncbi:MAG: ABC transporter permease [Planctomycetes bacterium]|nr:ABC transporter permease [Planctomycetota bacterium]
MALPLSYNWRNLFVRKLSTSLTFSVVSIIVAVLSILLSFAAGINDSLRSTGNPANIIVLRTGATAESTSLIKPDEANRVLQAPGIAQDDKGRTLASQELCAQTTLPRKDGRGIANVCVRGVDEIAFTIHKEVRLIEGRLFNVGQMEVIVGKAAQERYKHLALGEIVPMGRSGDRAYKVVGVFEADGSAVESEIWGPRTSIMDSFRRTFLSSVIVQVKDAGLAREAIDYLQGPAVRLKAKSETEYYEDLTSKTREIVVLTSVLITLMGIGAVFAVANTMYAAVDSRRREIAMLRTIGFVRRSIITAFVLESLLICMSACVCGLIIAALVSSMISKQDFLSDTTWTVLAYDLKMTPWTIGTALALAAAVGVIGGLAPAVRASRTKVIEALRKA